MAFTSYLTFQNIQELTNAAISSGLLTTSRVLLFQDIRRSFVATFQQDPVPLQQFRLDLNRLNSTERLEDNTVPLELYLRNASAQIADLPEGKIFERYRSLVANRSTGLRNLPQIDTLPEIIHKEAIIHQNDMLDLAFFERGLRIAKSVVKLEVPRYDSGVQRRVGSAPWLFLGTGWILAPGLLVTNHHVINSRRDEEGNAAPADFERQGMEANVLFDFDDAMSQTMPIRVAAVELTEENLDYCIMRLNNPPSRDPLPCRPDVVEIRASSYLPVNIIQHPGGLTKKLAIRNNLVAGADAETIRYYTDTDYGSSGSPVLDDQWRVVALHRGAIYTDGVQYQGRDTAYVNIGSQITRILSDIQQRKPTLYAEIHK